MSFPTAGNAPYDTRPSREAAWQAYQEAVKAGLRGVHDEMRRLRQAVEAQTTVLLQVLELLRKDRRDE
jgi:hypothetical protein